MTHRSCFAWDFPSFSINAGQPGTAGHPILVSQQSRGQDPALSDPEPVGALNLCEVSSPSPVCILFQGPWDSLQITLQPALGPGGCGHQRAPGALASGWARPWGAPAAAQTEGGEPGAARTPGPRPSLVQGPADGPGYSLWLPLPPLPLRPAW